MSFSPTPKSKAVLSRKLAEIKQTQRGSDISEALNAASGLANPGRTSDRNSNRDVQVADALAAKMFVFSDGAVKKIKEFSLGNFGNRVFPGWGCRDSSQRRRYRVCHQQRYRFRGARGLRPRSERRR